MVEKAIDVMRELRDDVNETVLLGTLVGTRGVILEQVLSTHPLKVMVDPGHNFALHTAAPAKAMLAYMILLGRNQLTNAFIRKTQVTPKRHLWERLAAAS